MFPAIAFRFASIAALWQLSRCQMGCILPEIDKVTFYVVETGLTKPTAKFQAGRFHEPGTVVEAVCFPGFIMEQANNFFKCLKNEISLRYQWNATLPQRCVSVWSECGMSSTPEKMSRGSSVDLGELPWMARIGVIYDDDSAESNMEVVHHCSGTLISSDYILAAAHCFTKGTIKIIEVSFGRTNFSGFSEGHVIRRARSPEIHPNYTVGDVAFTYDAALVRLKPPVDFERNIRPICLPDETSEICQESETSACKVVSGAGWGSNELLENSSDLKKFRLKLHPLDVCTENTKLVNLNSETHLCAGGIVNNEDACKGHSGGPLMCQLEGAFGKHYEIGIISFGNGCGRSSHPGAYVRTCAILPWLREKMNHVNRSVIKDSVSRRCKAPEIFNGFYTRVDNSTVSHGESFSHGEELVPNCNQPYIIEKAQILICSRNGTWLPPDVGECILHDCSRDNEPSVENGFIEPGSNSIGSTRVIHCSPGFQIHSDPYIICQSNGRWSLPGKCQMSVGGKTPKTAREEKGSNDMDPNIGISVAIVFVAAVPAFYIWWFKTWLDEPKTLALGRCPDTDNDQHNTFFHYLLRHHHRRPRYDPIAERLLVLVNSGAMIKKKIVLSDEDGSQSQKIAEQIFNNKHFLRKAKVGLLFWFDMDRRFCEKCFAERQIRPILRARQFIPHYLRDAPCHEELLKQLQHLYDCEIQSDRMRRFRNTIFVYNNVSGDDAKQYINGSMLEAFPEAWHIVIETVETRPVATAADPLSYPVGDLTTLTTLVENLTHDEELGSPRNSLRIDESHPTSGNNIARDYDY